MRTLVDLPEDDIKALDLLGKKESVSRAELVRRAIARYLEAEQENAKGDVSKYFGFLKDSSDAFDGLDGMAYQEKMRGEWDGRDKMYTHWALHDNSQEPYKSGPNQTKEE